jgi:3-dehydroquinate dehydratase-2
MAEIDSRMTALAGELGVSLTTYQSHLEGEMCARVHPAFID